MKTFIVEPSKYKIWLHYVCPECSYIHQIQPVEVGFPGGATCDCGCRLIWKPFSQLKIIPVYIERDISEVRSSPAILLTDNENDTKNNSSKVKIPTGREKVTFGGNSHLSMDIDDIIITLKKLGFSKTDARRLVDYELHQNRYQSSEGLLKAILSHT